jgi:hypothetical protein
VRLWAWLIAWSIVLSGFPLPAASRSDSLHLSGIPRGAGRLIPADQGRPPGPTAAVSNDAALAAVTPRTALTLRGVATWFKSPAGVSAAGPALRAAIGPGWRGSKVKVCRAGTDECVVTVLGDWCACGDRPGGRTLIDLDIRAFSRLAPLSRGVLSITAVPYSR